mmetsp:Transcript_27780/g.42522  ORF Transcript_27780/g.42522 Transcript_27780/m.42522 type:complete len:123 (-) Transcript_27780:408-776(-)
MLRLRSIFFVCVSLLVSLQDSVSAQHYATTTSRHSDDDLTSAALLAMTAVPSILLQQQVQATSGTTTSTFGVPARKVLDTLNVAVNTAVSVALAGALFCEFRSSSSSSGTTAHGIKKRGWRL